MVALSVPVIKLSRVALAIAAVDLSAKAIASALWSAEPLFLSPHFSLTLVHNVGGAFGLSAGAYTWQLNLALTLCAVVFVFPVARDLTKVDRRAPVALGLILGGALGNLASLVLPPEGVADFLAIQWRPGHSLVLNFADVAAYVGLAMIVRTGFRIVAAIRDEVHARSQHPLGSAYMQKRDAKQHLRGARPRVREALVTDWSNVVDLGVVRADEAERGSAGGPHPRPLGVGTDQRAVRLVEILPPDDAEATSGR